MKPKKRWIVLIVIAALLLVLVLGGFAVVKSYLGQVGRVDKAGVETIAPEDEFFDVDFTENPVVTTEPTEAIDPTETPEGSSTEPSESPANTGSETLIDTVIDPADVEWPFIDKIEDDHLINVLLVGQDRREGQGRQRSDSMILCSINPKSGEVSLISFLRDTYVQIPGRYSDNRLNVPYVYGGFELLDETFAVNFGISVDANFEVDFTGFEAIIDMIGGIEIELTAAEAEHMSNALLMPATEGLNHFDGRYARRFAQIRKIDSDFGRTNRQREVLLAVFDKVKDLSFGEQLDLMYKALPYLTTDLTDSEILSLAYRLLPLVSSMDISTYSVPSKGNYQSVSIRGMAVLLPDLEAIRAKLEEEYLPLQ